MGLVPYSFKDTFLMSLHGLVGTVAIVSDVENMNHGVGCSRGQIQAIRRPCLVNKGRLSLTALLLPSKRMYFSLPESDVKQP